MDWIFSLLLSSSFASPLQINIINGENVKAEDPIAKSTVYITGQIVRATFSCTGVILAEDIILTAGHCLGGGGWAKLTVHFGPQGKNPVASIPVVGQKRRRDIPPPNGLGRDDVAVLKLASRIPAGFVPATLLPNSNLLKDQAEIILAGYGRTTPYEPKFGNGGIGTLRKVRQRILDTRYAEREVLVDITGKGSCTGDSGGPAFLETDSKLFVWGIASHLTENDRLPDQGRERRYACIKDLVYTNVIEQLPWIEQAITEL